MDQDRALLLSQNDLCQTAAPLFLADRTPASDRQRPPAIDSFRAGVATIRRVKQMVLTAPLNG
jgi:hypothetical protein